ncbi:Thioredoxin reductase GliT-like protein [Penicillium malachiteum]|nr:Thioredoxin reductase GliT-like protein [Penicillium malachiteum]
MEPESSAFDIWTKRIFHCLFCHGYEDRGAPSTGVLGVQSGSIPPPAIHFAENAAQLSDSVTIYTHGSEELATKLDTELSKGDKNFKVDTRVIARIHMESSKSIRLEFADGSSATETFLVHNPSTTVNGPFFEQLSEEMTASPHTGISDIAADPPGFQTNVRGVFVAGDSMTPYKVIPNAIYSVNRAGVGASAQLLAEKYGHTPML